MGSTRLLRGYVTQAAGATALNSKGLDPAQVGRPPFRQPTGRATRPDPAVIIAGQVKVRRYGLSATPRLSVLTLSVCSFRIWSRFPDATSQLRAGPSMLAVTICRPSGLKTAEVTSPLWPETMSSAFSRTPSGPGGRRAPREGCRGLRYACSSVAATGIPAGRAAGYPRERGHSTAEDADGRLHP